MCVSADLAHQVLQSVRLTFSTRGGGKKECGCVKVRARGVVIGGAKTFFFPSGSILTSPVSGGLRYFTLPEEILYLVFVGQCMPSNSSASAHTTLEPPPIL
ncbi:hypothetical protein E2C01_026249 [Portunus trituberculatus]|uniref:Uncharacterized protein n=1 Tax=Portunus trituberculatus TaxID=210409 RepID=A0A5B7EHP2_PORTR|nr:hypothetical protein [Portunus trituberculatus]